MVMSSTQVQAPIQAQAKLVAQSTIRDAFEPDAFIVSPVRPYKEGWQCIYRSQGTYFHLTYDGKEFVKKKWLNDRTDALDPTLDVPDDAPDAEVPDSDDVLADWDDAVPTQYQGMLDAQTDDRTSLSAGIAAAILLAAWLWNRKKGVYLAPETRQPLPPDVLTTVVQQRIDKATQQLGDISIDDLDEWHDRALTQILLLHSSAFAAGRGGFNQMSDDDEELLSQLLRFQQYRLSVFKQAIADRLLSTAQVNDRLSKYSASALASFYYGQQQAMAASGFKYAQRFLNPAEHCDDCIGYADQGKKKIGDLPPPCVASACIMNCKCSIKYYRK